MNKKKKMEELIKGLATLIPLIFYGLIIIVPLIFIVLVIVILEALTAILCYPLSIKIIPAYFINENKGMNS